MKVIFVPKLNEREEAEKEIEIMKKLDHPNVIKYIDHFMSADNLYICIIVEFAEKGNLRTFMCNFTLPEDKVLEMFTEFFLAIHYLHSQNFIHRDLKPENVLLDSLYRIKVTDFGHTRKLMDDMQQTKSRAGTLIYNAPEMLLGEYYQKPADIWAAGVMLYEMLSDCNRSGKFLF